MDRSSLLPVVFFAGTGLLATIFAVVATITGRNKLPDTQTKTTAPASLPVRLAAFITDFFIVLIIWSLLVGLGACMEAIGLGYGWPLLASCFTLPIIPLIYFTVPYVAGKQTPGKRWAGIALEHKFGIRIGGSQALWRTILMLLLSFGVLLLVDLLIIAIHPAKRGLRDLLSGTRVRQISVPQWSFTLAPLSATLIFVIALYGVIRPYCMRTFFIPTLSMQPTLQREDKLFANLLYYHIQPLRRGDIVVFRMPDAVGFPGMPIVQNDYFIKRVIGLPGDSIQFRDGSGIFVNGKRVTYRLPAPSMNWPDKGGAYRVPAGQCFVIGDNVDNSFDSRFWQDLRTGKPVPGLPIHSINGRVTIICWPLNRIKPLR